MKKCLEQKIKDIDEMRKLQLESVTNKYMQGLYNGLELSLATLEERDPVFINKIVDSKPVFDKERK